MIENNLYIIQENINALGSKIKKKEELESFEEEISRRFASICASLDQLSCLQEEKVWSEFKTKSFKVLDKTFSLLNELKTNGDVPQEIVDRINKIQSDNTISQIKQKIEKLEVRKIGFRGSILSDVDCHDHNGAIFGGVLFALKSHMPLITTTSIINGTFWEGNGVLKAIGKFLIKLFLRLSSWKIYKKGEFVALIPAGLSLEKSDFDKDSKGVVEISSKDLFKPGAGSGGKNLEDLFGFFKKDPSADKLFYLGGHGGGSGDNQVTAGLNPKNFQRMINFLKGQRVLGASIISCFSGGVSSLQYLQSSTDTTKEKFPFPVILRSTGEFGVYLGLGKAENNPMGFFEELGHFVESTKGQTTSQLRKTLEKVEKNTPKSKYNMCQVYFPASPGVPQGFRVVGEGNAGFAITENLLKQHRAKKKDKIAVKNKSLLQLHPLSVPLHITCQGKDPIPLSMVPGSSHHYVESMELGRLSPTDFVKKTSDFYLEGGFEDSEIRKGFFIGSLKKGKSFSILNFFKKGTPWITEESWEKVVLLLGPAGLEAAYLEGNTYHLLKKGVQEKEITTTTMTASDYTNFYLKVMSQTRPHEVSARAATGGQETEETFQEALREKFGSPTPSTFVEAFWMGDLDRCKTLQGKAQEVEHHQLLLDLASENDFKEKVMVAKQLPSLKRTLSRDQLATLSKQLSSLKMKSPSERAEVKEILLKSGKFLVDKGHLKPLDFWATVCRIGGKKKTHDFVCESAKYLLDKKKITIKELIDFCLGHDHLEVLKNVFDDKYLYDSYFASNFEYAFKECAEKNHLEFLKYMHESIGKKKLLDQAAYKKLIDQAFCGAVGKCGIGIVKFLLGRVTLSPSELQYLFTISVLSNRSIEATLLFLRNYEVDPSAAGNGYLKDVCGWNSPEVVRAFLEHSKFDPAKPLDAVFTQAFMNKNSEIVRVLFQSPKIPLEEKKKALKAANAMGKYQECIKSLFFGSEQFWLGESAPTTPEDKQKTIRVAFEYGFKKEQATGLWEMAKSLIDSKKMEPAHLLQSACRCVYKAEAKEFLDQAVPDLLTKMEPSELFRTCFEGGQWEVLNKTNLIATYRNEFFVLAAQFGYLNFMKQLRGLVKKGLLKAAQTSESITQESLKEALLRAVTERRLDVIAYLLEDYDPPNREELLLLGVSARDPEIIKLLIKKFDHALFNRCLLEACKTNQIQIVTLLLDDSRFKNPDLRGAFDIATSNRNSAILKFLYSKLTEKEKQETKKKIEKRAEKFGKGNEGWLRTFRKTTSYAGIKVQNN